MTFAKLKPILVTILFLSLAACSKERSIYQGLGPDEDGVIAIGVPDEGDPAPKPEPLSRMVDELAPHEKDLVDQWHDGEVDKLSFVVIDVDNKKVIKSYFSNVPQRLASITKLSRACSEIFTKRRLYCVSQLARV